MGIISKSELADFRNRARIFSRNVDESLRDFKTESRLNKVTIFLSHKHDELKELDSAINFLKTFGVNVYVDWLDEDMPKSTSGATARRIKQKIKENKKFIFLATEGAINSKWCNWELGHGDAEKYLDHVAILPIRNTYSDYNGAEYLEIYPYIYESDFTPGTFYLKFPDATIVSLASWLKS